MWNKQAKEERMKRKLMKIEGEGHGNERGG